MFAHLTEYPEYVSHKVVKAFKIKSINTEPVDKENMIGLQYIITPAVEGLPVQAVEHEWYVKHKPEIDGYVVFYSDGYVSYSPAKAFEEGYKLTGN